MVTRSRSPFLLLFCLVIAVAGGIGCSKNQPKTTVAGSWTNPDLGGATFERIFVIGAGRDDEYRRLYEDSLVTALESEGVSAVASYEVLPQSTELTEAQIRDAVGAGDFDAVMVTSLLHVDEIVEEVPATTVKVPTGQVPYSAAGFYEFAYDTVHVPGYHNVYKRYNIEARLYRFSDGERVWWGLSETVNPDSVQEIINTVSVAMAKQLQGDGLVP
ncbi:MAG: hypothetical protein AAGF92_06705 [Myxococcota bacterium]